MKKTKIPPSPLFQGIAPEEMEPMLSCLSATQKSYEKGDFLFHMGDFLSTVGLVLRGAVHILKEDFWGNRQILATIEPGQLFGESYACVRDEPLLINVVAAEPTEVLFLDVKRILTTCSSSCMFHARLIHNLLSILASKNRMLTRKIDHISQRSTREKVLSYLSFQASHQGSRTFTIPFSRQQLADYLAVDRSALSAELSKMQKEGLLSFHRNQFSLSCNPSVPPA